MFNTWNVSYSDKEKGEWFELRTTIPVQEDTTVRDIYFMLLKRKLIKRFPRKIKKSLYYMGSKGNIHKRALRYLCKYLVVEEKGGEE